MKKVFLLGFALFSLTVIAQKGNGYGINAGLNYNSNGEFYDSAKAAVEEPTRNIGYHFGLFGKMDFGLFYVRPEALYTHTSSEYSSGDFTVSKLDVPLLAGVTIVGPVSVFAGPSLQYLLKTEFEGFDLDDANEKFTVGAQFGVALNFEKLGVDVRYERGLSKNEIDFADVKGNRIDARPDQVILSLSLKL